MRLKDIAYSRTGDKGNISNVSLIPYKESDYPLLLEKATAARVKAWFRDIVKGEVKRYEFPGVKALNFVMDKALGGGVTRSLALDKHGKAISSALLEMPLD